MQLGPSSCLDAFASGSLQSAVGAQSPQVHFWPGQHRARGGRHGVRICPQNEKHFWREKCVDFLFVFILRPNKSTHFSRRFSRRVFTQVFTQFSRQGKKYSRSFHARERNIHAAVAAHSYRRLLCSDQERMSNRCMIEQPSTRMHLRFGGSRKPLPVPGLHFALEIFGVIGKISR